jgi:hypothetical protein
MKFHVCYNMSKKFQIVSFQIERDEVRRLDDAVVYLKMKSRSDLLRSMLLRYLNQEIEPAMKADNWFNNRRSVQEILNGTKT